MQIRTSGLTAVTVLVLAVGGGAVGGALVAGNQPAPSPAVQFDQAAAAKSKPTQAQKAAAAAKRAEKAAARAEKAAAAAEAVARKLAPTPVPPECSPEGSTRGVPYKGGSGPGWTPGQGGTDTCQGGKWVRTKEPVDAIPPPPAQTTEPDPPLSTVTPPVSTPVPPHK